MADTIRTQSDLLTNLFQDGQAANSITEQDMRDLIVSHKLRGGWADYNDLTTATTPISVTGGAGYVDLTNDGAGAFTNKQYLAPGVTDLWNTGTNRFDWTALDMYDSVDIRVDVEVTTSGANTDVELAMEMGLGASPYDLPFSLVSYKTAGVYQLTKFNGVYMGDANTKDNPARLKIKADNNITVKVNGWWMRICKH